ncbi:MAG: adenylate kinase [Chromatiales bacterium]
MRIVLLGAPGSGKRTQTMLMVERYGIPSIFTGELLRNALAAETPWGQQLKEAMEEGRSITEEVVLELIRERLQQEDARPGFVLDGFPRNILQAITLDELLYEMELPIELALLIDIETDLLMERLVGRRTCRSCGAQYNIYSNPTTVEGVCDLCGGGLRHRADDNEETISSRLHVYDHLVSPLIKHYTRQKKLQRIDGSGGVEEVFARICEAVDSHVPPPVQEPLSVYEAAVVMEGLEGHNSEKAYALIPGGSERSESMVSGLDLDQMLQDTQDQPPKVRKKASAARKKVVREKPSVAQEPTQQTAKETPSKQQTRASKTKAKKKASVKKSPVKSRPAANAGKTSKKRAVAAKVKEAQKGEGRIETGRKKVSVKKSAAGKKAASKKKAVKKSSAATSKQVVKKQAKKKVGAKKKSAKAAGRKKQPSR